jgi:hypothetical protein
MPTMLVWPIKMKTWTGLLMSSGLPSGFGLGCSSAETVPNDASANAVIAMDDRAIALRVRWLCFLIRCLFCVVL